jgi:hypothetical protein
MLLTSTERSRVAEPAFDPVPPVQRGEKGGRSPSTSRHRHESARQTLIGNEHAASIEAMYPDPITRTISWMNAYAGRPQRHHHQVQRPPTASLQLARSTIELSGTKVIIPQPATTDKPALAHSTLLLIDVISTYIPSRFVYVILGKTKRWKWPVTA